MVRAYAPDRPVSSELLDRVCAAALRVPSAGFTQGVSLLVLTDVAQREAYWSATAGAAESRWLAGMRTAPALILVWTSQDAYLDRYAEPDKGWSDRDPERWSAPYWFVDGGMAVLAMLLTATDAGLGAGFFGVPAARTAAVARRLRGAGGAAQRRRGQPGLRRVRRGARIAGAPASTTTRRADPLRDVVKHAGQ